MELSTLLTEDRAVSPVIGVILMVAITVILAAVIGTFVLGLGQNVQSTPSASFDFDFASNNSVNITHNGGDTISSEDAIAVSVNSSNDSASWLAAESDGEISAGDTAPIVGHEDDDTVRVIWEDPNGESSATLGQQDAPA